MSRKIISSLVAVAALSAMSVCAQEIARTPNTYGTVRESLYRVGFSEFTPFNSATTYSDLAFLGTNLLSRYATSGSGGFVAVPHLPGGAVVTGIELDYCDTSGVWDVVMDVIASSAIGTGTTIVGSVSSNGTSGGCGSSFADLTSAGIQIDNATTQLSLQAYTPAFDSTTAISGAIIHYKLQVSPAPGTPTFNDVPTSDFGFQFIEAFNAAGITVGCNVSPPQFCPDRNVTRREMAVFFAKALGLEFQ